MLKKSEVLKEGYIMGLRVAQKLIAEAIEGNSGVKRVIFDENSEAIRKEVEELKKNALEEPEYHDYVFKGTSLLKYYETGDKKSLVIDEDKLVDAASQNVSEYCQRQMVDVVKPVLKDLQVLVIGNLGLWDGQKKGMNLYEDGFDALSRLLEDYNKLYVDDEYNLILEAIHHDGTNTFFFYEYNENAVENFIKNNQGRVKELENMEGNTLYNLGELFDAYDLDYITLDELKSMLSPLGQQFLNEE